MRTDHEGPLTGEAFFGAEPSAAISCFGSMLSELLCTERVSQILLPMKKDCKFELRGRFGVEKEENEPFYFYRSFCSCVGDLGTPRNVEDGY